MLASLFISPEIMIVFVVASVSHATLELLSSEDINLK